MTGWNLPDGCTAADIDRAMGGDIPECPECDAALDGYECTECGYCDEPDWEALVTDRADRAMADFREPVPGEW